MIPAKEDIALAANKVAGAIAPPNSILAASKRLFAIPNFAANVSVAFAYSSSSEVPSRKPVSAFSRFSRSWSKFAANPSIAFLPVVSKSSVATASRRKGSSILAIACTICSSIAIGSSPKARSNSSLVIPSNLDISSVLDAICANARDSRVPESEAFLLIETKVAPIASASEDVKPNICALAPSEAEKSIKSCSFASVVFPSTLIALPNFLTSEICKPYTLVIFAIAMAASSSAISKETAISETVFVNSIIFSFPVIPSCPATRPIFAKFAADVGISLDNSINSSRIAAISALLIPVVFRTPAIAESSRIKLSFRLSAINFAPTPTPVIAVPTAMPTR